MPDIHLVLPSTIAIDRVRQLAKEWTKGLPRGWQQIEAIESRLREQYTLDRTVRISADSESPVAEFLLERRRGPEYLFATSAACLLRSLDYPARLVSGFYADPKNYDPRKQHTSVFAETPISGAKLDSGSTRGSPLSLRLATKSLSRHLACWQSCGRASFDLSVSSGSTRWHWRCCSQAWSSCFGCGIFCWISV